MKVLHILPGRYYLGMYFISKKSWPFDGVGYTSILLGHGRLQHSDGHLHLIELRVLYTGVKSYFNCRWETTVERDTGVVEERSVGFGIETEDEVLMGLTGTEALVVA